MKVHFQKPPPDELSVICNSLRGYFHPLDSTTDPEKVTCERCAFKLKKAGLLVPKAQEQNVQNCPVI